jgi:hypothetical protein
LLLLLLATQRDDHGEEVPAVVTSHFVASEVDGGRLFLSDTTWRHNIGWDASAEEQDEEAAELALVAIGTLDSANADGLSVLCSSV